MAGIKQWFRSRSRSRSQRSDDKREGQQPSEQGSAPPLPPLPLLRPDSSYNKLPQQQQQQQQSSQEAKSRPVSEIRGNRRTDSKRRDSTADDTLSVASSNYSNVVAGPSPATGTYPLHGNSHNRFPSQSGKRSSKSPARTPSMTSAHYRNLSGATADERHSVPPGTALSVDIPASAPSSSKQPASLSGQPLAAPMAPQTSGTIDGLASGSLNGAKPPTTTNGVTNGENSKPHPLRHQPDMGNLHSKAASEQSTGIPQRQSSLSGQPLAQDVRGRTPQRPSDRPLPIPKELENAPWNRQQPIGNGQSTQEADLGDDLANRVAPLSLKQRPGPRELNPEDNLQSEVPLSEPSPIDESLESQYATPSFEIHSMDTGISPFVQAEVKKGPQKKYTKDLVVEDAAQPPSLDGIVDLSKTEDTSVHVKYAPAVTHEVIKPEVHHIREERITREIHTHETHHRILPIIDVQVLPAKHFVPSADGAGFVEVSAEQIPGRTLDAVNNRNWVIAETVSRALAPNSKAAKEPRQFTARTFPGTEGDYQEETGADGVLRTKTTWVHPPTIDEGAKKRGLTMPLEMD